MLSRTVYKLILPLMKNTYISLLFFLISAMPGLAQRGYFDAPYVRYEANQGSLSNASVTSKSFNQANLQSEASEQICVNMTNNGSAVEWTVSNQGDGLVIRYSVPDGESGRLGIYVNGSKVGTVDLTSYYSWEYLWADGNPNNSGVTNTNPRMRFDEVRYKLPSKINVGGKLRLVNESGNIHIDFAELELVPNTVNSSGGDAVYNGNGSNLQNFIDNNRGRTIYLPPGIYYVNRELYFGFDNTKLKGAGMWHTQIHFTNNSALQGGLRANASNVSYSGLYLTTVRNSRSNSYKGINGVYTSGSVISDIWVEHFETGAWIAQFNSGGPAVTNGLIVENCRFRNNYADGINLSKGTLNSVVEHCSFRNNGDDDMAIWSANGQECRNNTFRYNTSENCWRASGCAIYGGYNNKAHNLLIKDNVEVGIKVNNNFPGVGFNNNGLHEFYDITILRCGTFSDLFRAPVGAIDMTCNDVAGNRVQNVKFSNIDIIDSKNDAIYMHKKAGSGFYNLIFENITINGTGKEVPFNNPRNLNWGRGFGFLITGYPAGNGTYCNLNYSNIGGNVSTTTNFNQIGSFSFTQNSNCASVEVSITSPQNGTSLSGCKTDLTISANASTSSGNISKVEFFANGQKIGEDNNAPYSIMWNNVPKGNHDISAKATASPSSSTATSDIVSISVENGIRATATAPTIDGVKDGIWNNFQAVSLNKVLFDGDGIISDADLSAKYYAVMDNTYLYVLVEVNDDILINDSPTNETWKDDKVELYIDYGNDKNSEYGNNDHSFGFVYNDPTLYVGPGDNTGASFKQGNKTGGYIIEVRIPWNTIGGAPSYGSEIGLEVMVNDDDDGGSRDSKIALTDDTDNAWNNPSLFGTSVLFPATTKKVSLCSGESYTFPDGTVQTNITSEIKYTSVFNSTSGCDSLVTTTVTPTIINNEITISNNTLVAMHATGNYQWVNCNNGNSAVNGATNRTFNPASTGNYAVRIQEGNCTVESDCENIVLNSIQEKYFGKIYTYPNPSDGYFKLETADFDVSKIKVYNSLGFLVKEFAYKPDNSIDLSDQTSGYYFIELISETGESFKMNLHKL